MSPMVDFTALSVMLHPPFFFPRNGFQPGIHCCAGVLNQKKNRSALDSLIWRDLGLKEFFQLLCLPFKNGSRMSHAEVSYFCFH